MKQKLVMLISIILILFISVDAAPTGKIMGTVIDSETEEPLTGVNIVIPDLETGAASDQKGRFTITNIPPGTYKIKATRIGYANYILSNVQIEVNRTTRVEIEMKTEQIQGEAVEVVAEQEVVEKDVAGSQRSVSSDEIDQLPVNDIGDIVAVKAGISSDLSIRGSDAEEALFAVDGIAMRDRRTNQPMMSVPMSAMKDVSVTTGGLSAQYSNVRSGVVNVVSKDGSKDSYSGTVTIRQSPPQKKHFGKSPYHPESTWLRPFTDPEVAWEGTDQWDRYTRRQYQDFRGWNQFARNLNTDDNPDNDMTPAGAQRLFEWQYRKDGRIEKPDRTIDFGFGGPVPMVSDKLGDLRFYLSHRRQQSMYPFELSRDGVYNNTTMLKLTSDITSSMKLSIQGINGNTKATTASRGGGTSYFTSAGGVASALDRAGFTIPWRLYTNSYWAPTEKDFNILSVKLNRMITSKSNYTIQLKRTNKNYDTSPGRVRDTTKKYDIFPREDASYMVDEAPFGFWPKPEESIEGGIIMGGAVSTARDYSEFTTYELKFDYTNQIHPNNQLKTGFKVIYNDYNIKFGSVNEFLPAGNYWTEFDRNPYRVTGYIEDKLEYEGFIITAGIIPQMVAFNGKWFDTEGTYDKDFYSGNYSEEEDKDEYLTKEVDPKFYLSPRLGISHPVTEDSKLYFNYGHYRQVPDAENAYRIQRDAQNKLTLIGDPTLPLTKTVSYEVGFDQSIGDMYLMHIAAYYKDISDQNSYVDYINIDGKVNYSKLTPNNYENIRGFEFELSKKYGKWLTGMLNYEYRAQDWGYFGSETYYENPADQREHDRRNPYRQYRDPAEHNFKAYTNFHTPKEFGPEIAGKKPLAGWRMNLIGNLGLNRKTTWNPNGVPGINDNLDQVPYHNIDLKFSKTFKFGNAKLELFADVYNLFNVKRFSGEGFVDIHDYNNYMYSLHLSEDQYDKLGYQGIPGDDEYGEYRESDVEFQPLEYTDKREDINNPSDRAIYYDASRKEYYSYESGEWQSVKDSRINEIKEKNAYIDMPNQSFLNFLNPRDIYIGITISYDF